MAHFRRVKHFSATPSIFAGVALIVLGGLAVIAATIGVLIIGDDRCDGTSYCLRFILEDYCVGIWCGSLFFVSGLCSFAAGKRPYRALIIVHSVISFLSIVFAAVLITVAGITVGLSFDNRVSPPSIRPYKIVPIPCPDSRNNDYYWMRDRTIPDYGRRWNLDEQVTPSYGRQWYDDSTNLDYWRPWIGDKYRTPPYYWRIWNLDEQSTPSYWKQWYDDSTTQDYWRQWIRDRDRTTADYWRRWNLYEGQTTPSENRTQWYDDNRPTTPDYWREWFGNRDRNADDDWRRWNEQQKWDQNAVVTTAETTSNGGFEENATDTSDANTTVHWWHMFIKDNDYDEGTTTPSSNYEQNNWDDHPDYDRKKRQARQDCHAMEINAGWLTQLIMSCFLVMIGFLAFILSIIITTTSWLPFCCPPEEDQNADSKKQIPRWQYRPPCFKTLNEIPTLEDGEFNSNQSQYTMIDIVKGVTTDKVSLFVEGSGSGIVHV